MRSRLVVFLFSALAMVAPAAPAHAATSPYLLPWQPGNYFELIQGNNSVADHQGIEAYAFDFPMAAGTLILAARTGTVSMMKDDSNIGGFNIAYAGDANYVVIDHGDGTQAFYLHLMYHGALARVGQHVQQGQPIALSGDTGWTSGPHLHFVVEQASPDHQLTQSLPIRFADVSDWGGVPQPGRWYTSQNALTSPALALPPIVQSRRLTPASAIANSIEGNRLDYDIPHGHFFKEANGRGGAGITGYIVTDDQPAPIWQQFGGLGGVPALGYPIADRFTLDGFTVQAFQKAVVQWHPTDGRFYFLNVLDLLHANGDDAWLQSSEQIPPAVDNSADAALTWNQVMARHLSFLAGNPALRAFYYATPDWLDRYGLPTSAVTDEGNVLVVRCQRAALQLWKVNEPWAQAGQVTVANGGDLLKARGWLPDYALGVDYAPVP
ncbi:MAG TPA: M23 family metallopeptidase [Chloroflexota bacterium]|jgi:hypothetical protein|nr:M23 family metallopeptidase [Chloroflexota bacterium]